MDHQFLFTTLKLYLLGYLVFTTLLVVSAKGEKFTSKLDVAVKMTVFWIPVMVLFFKSIYNRTTEKIKKIEDIIEKRKNGIALTDEEVEFLEREIPNET